MKKFISAVLSVMLVFGISTSAFANPLAKTESSVTCKFIDFKAFTPFKILFELFNSGNTKPEVKPPQVQTPPSQNEDEKDEGQSNITSASEFELEVLNLVNAERAKHDLSPLSWDESLATVARAHSKDMAQRNFFSHTNPDGKSPFDRLKENGISYSYAAENIAAGQDTPQAVVTAWMNSTGHRKNILSSSATKLGVGYYKSDSGYLHYWTQCFTA